MDQLLLYLRFVELVKVSMWVWVVLTTGLQSGWVNDSVIVIPGNTIHQQAVRGSVPSVAFVARRWLLHPVGFDARQYLMECVSHGMCLRVFSKWHVRMCDEVRFEDLQFAHSMSGVANGSTDIPRILRSMSVNVWLSALWAREKGAMFRSQQAVHDGVPGVAFVTSWCLLLMAITHTCSLVLLRLG